MKRRANNQTPGDGYDSFLDIVANLVGILIILIMVVGMKARSSMMAAATAQATPKVEAVPTEPVAYQSSEAVEKERELRALEAEIADLDIRIDNEVAAADFRDLERKQALMIISTAEQKLNTVKSGLSQSEQDRLNAEAQLAAAQAELDEIERQRESLLQDELSTGILEHLPTPLAKTVFGREMHFRLKGGRVAYVPLYELVDLRKQDVPSKVYKLKSQPRIEETIGPLQGWTMTYELKLVEQSIDVGNRTVKQVAAASDAFIVEPERSDIGWPIDESLREGSTFWRLVQGGNKDTTTVTFWVYPDSFTQFRTFKQALFDKGYLTAGRPIISGQPIGGSSNGTRSSAE